MRDTTLDKLLSAVEVSPHPFSVCRIQSGWRMKFPVFTMITVHFVLRGRGLVQVGGAPPLAFEPSSVMIVPAGLAHWVGDADPSAALGDAADKCALIADGLVEFTAGDGAADTLLLCAAVSRTHDAALGRLDLPHQPVVDHVEASGIPSYIFEAMRHEIASARLGAQAICQALMKQALVSLVRERWSRAGDPPVAAGAIGHPRLARAIVAIVEDPGAQHSVGGLAELAGMSRASFCDHFTRKMGQAPMEFVQKTRLHSAARLLGASDLPVKVIAVSVGYAGASSFSRAFEEAYGASPTLYRAQRAQAERVDA